MNTRITYPAQERYSEAFKRQVVQEYERGNVTKDDLQRKYHIGGHSTVLQWCRKYGRLSYPNIPGGGRPMNDPQQRRIKALERELKEAKEKLLVYEKLIEITNRSLGRDVRKNIVTKLSENWQPKEHQ